MGKGGRKDFLSQGKISDILISCARNTLSADTRNWDEIFYIFEQFVDKMKLNIFEIVGNVTSREL